MTTSGDRPDQVTICPEGIAQSRNLGLQVVSDAIPVIYRNLPEFTRSGLQSVLIASVDTGAAISLATDQTPRSNSI